MKNSNKIVTWIMLTWLLASCTNQAIEPNETVSSTWENIVQENLWLEHWKWNRTWMTEEQKAEREQIQELFHKKENGETLTAEEEAKLAEIKSRLESQKNRFKEWGESTTTNQPSLTASDVEWKVLAIDHKCVGCGHCVRTAPNNFSMSWNKATVISQENLSDASVSSAISRCPVSAISLS